MKRVLLLSKDEILDSFLPHCCQARWRVWFLSELHDFKDLGWFFCQLE